MIEKAWFQSFVVGDEADFHEYIAEKRRDHVWGDDPEIQVRSRPAYCCPGGPAPVFLSRVARA